MIFAVYTKRIVIIAGPNGAGEATFAHGINNFARYKLLVDSWQLYDNSAIPAALIEEGHNQ